MRGVSLITFSLFLLLSAIFSEADQLIHKNQTNRPFFHSLVSSFVYPIKGNVYPIGSYVVSINIGNPPKPYDLDFDTGSDFTWIQCDDPCIRCTVPKEKLYKPHGNYAKCSDPLCSAIPSISPCPKPNDPCTYTIKYADGGTSAGKLVRDYVLIGTTKTPTTQPLLAFGCGYEQKFSEHTPSTVGVLGLGSGKLSILSQLNSLGLIRKVLGHCLSLQGEGYLFLGDKFIPSSGVNWIPINKNSGPHYNVGPADLLFDGKPSPIKGFQLIFDSGTTYTYFIPPIYNAIVNQISTDLKGKPLVKSKDNTLTICWESNAKPIIHFKSLNEVKGYFKPLTLSFTKSKNLPFQIPPESYLIISEFGNVCLGILEGHQNVNLIGDISMQDKVVIYDNEKQQIGWASANCKQIPH